MTAAQCSTPARRLRSARPAASELFSWVVLPWMFSSRFTKIGFDDMRICHQPGGRARERHAALFQNIGLLRDAQRLARVLLHHEHGDSVAVDFRNEIED